MMVGEFGDQHRHDGGHGKGCRTTKYFRIALAGVGLAGILFALIADRYLDLAYHLSGTEEQLLTAGGTLQNVTDALEDLGHVGLFNIRLVHKDFSVHKEVCGNSGPLDLAFDILCDRLELLMFLILAPGALISVIFFLALLPRCEWLSNLVLLTVVAFAVLLAVVGCAIWGEVKSKLDLLFFLPEVLDLTATLLAKLTSPVHLGRSFYGIIAAVVCMFLEAVVLVYRMMQKGTKIAGSGCLKLCRCLSCCCADGSGPKTLRRIPFSAPSSAAAHPSSGPVSNHHSHDDEETPRPPSSAPPSEIADVAVVPFPVPIVAAGVTMHSHHSDAEEITELRDHVQDMALTDV